MVATKTDLKSRLVDITIVLVVFALFYEGYAKSHHYRETRDSVLQPLLILCGFVAALYPFRPHTRILWLVVVPFGAAILPLLGYNAHMRLTAAPGYEMPSNIARLAMCSIMFFASTAIWLLPACLGWKLQAGPDMNSKSRTMGLRELFAMTGIACVLLVFFRDSFITENSESQIRSLRMPGVFFWLRQPATWLFIILVGASFYFNWRLAIIVAVLTFLCVSMIEWHQAHDAAIAAQQRYQSRGIPRPSDAFEVPYYLVAKRHAWQITLLVAVILAGRLAGYRLARKFAQPADADGDLPRGTNSRSE